MKILDRLLEDKLLGVRFAVNVFIGSIIVWITLRFFTHAHPIWAIASMIASSEPVMRQGLKMFGAFPRIPGESDEQFRYRVNRKSPVRSDLRALSVLWGFRKANRLATPERSDRVQTVCISPSSWGILPPPGGGACGRFAALYSFEGFPIFWAVLADVKQWPG